MLDLRSIRIVWYLLYVVVFAGALTAAVPKFCTPPYPGMAGGATALYEFEPAITTWKSACHWPLFVADEASNKPPKREHFIRVWEGGFGQSSVSGTTVGSRSKTRFISVGAEHWEGQLTNIERCAALNIVACVGTNCRIVRSD